MDEQGFISAVVTQGPRAGLKVTFNGEEGPCKQGDRIEVA